MSFVALLVVLAAVAGWAAYAAFAASPPPAPTITASPAAFSNSSSASFGYKVSGSITRFECSRDGGSYVTCGPSSPGAVSYSGLAAGSHTFAVRAVSSSGTGSATSFSWTVDLTAPTLTSIGAVGSSPTNAASVAWTVKFSEDVNGVLAGNFALVAVGLGGTAPVITSVTPSSGPASIWTVTASTGTTTPSGSGTLQLKLQNSSGIQDRAGNSFSGPVPAAGATYTIDKTAPAAPVISSGPAASPAWTTSTNASFGFTGEGSSSFLCKLDGGSFAACASPKNYGGLAQGSHTLQVEQVDQAGNTSPAASRTWQIDTVAPAAPTLTGKPSDPTNQTTGTFSFTDEPGATFLCKRDGDPAFTACSSGVSYSSLGMGSHSFQVEAKDAAGNIGAATTWTWTIDQTPPSITVSFPANGGVYNASGWSSGCSGGAGICGSATDPQGVAAGLVSIQQQSSGKWWNGSTFNSTSEVFNNASQTGGSGSTYTGRYGLSLPPDGFYTIHVRATDRAGNTTPAGSQVTLSFRIKAIKPPAPIFDSTPPNPNNTATSTFAWHDTEAGVSYECSKENGSFQPCTSPLTYAVQTTNNGEHQFAVRAIDAAGNVSDVASYTWKVAAGSPQNFAINGSVTGLLIGVQKSVPVTINNPNSVPIYVNAITITLTVTAGSGGCTASNFQTTAWTAASTAQEFQVPANATNFSVPAAAQPKLLLKNLPTNQDVCKNKTFSLSFTGSAHS